MALSGFQSLRLRWIGWRNGILADPGFRRRVAALPPLRPVARRYARDIFDLGAGFVYAQIAKALIESGLIAALGARPRRLGEAAALAALPDGAAATLLKAGLPHRLTERVGDLWLLGSRGAALSTSPGVAEMIAHHRLLYADLADPLAMLRGDGAGALARLWRYDGSADPADVAAYSALMAASQPMVAEQALAAYRFARHRRLLDIGGGAGAFLGAIGRAVPALELGLFDLPAVVAGAAARIAESGRAVTLHPGDFRHDPIPSGYDLITLVRVLHDHDDGPASRLLAAAGAALPPGGRLLIVEPLAETRGAAAMGHGYFGFYLAAMRSGRPRSFKEYKQMALDAGFARARLIGTPVPLVASVIQLSR